jgi:3'-phosphoadenosine 5'-phosphosulfate (PAPS) 3'-phosphatase
VLFVDVYSFASTTACRMVTTYPASSGVACQILLGENHVPCRRETPAQEIRPLQITNHKTIGADAVLGDYHISAVVHDNNSSSVKVLRALGPVCLVVFAQCSSQQAAWDTAAPQLIVEEAGGVFLNARNGQRYDTLQPDVILVAASADLAAEILRLLA